MQEVAPPGAVQQLRRRLDRRRPVLRLISPSDDAVINASSVNLVFAVDDWPLAASSGDDGGPKVMVQVDADLPIQLTPDENNQLQVRLDDLHPGSHRFSAWAAYPWGEAVKTQVHPCRVASTYGGA